MSYKDNGLQYLELTHLSTDDLNRLLKSNNESDVCNGILSACKFVDDYDYVLRIIKRFAFNASDNIKLNILNGLSLVTYNHEKIDTKLAFEIIDFYSNNCSALQIKNMAQEVKNEIKHYSKLYKFPIDK